MSQALRDHADFSARIASKLTKQQNIDSACQFVAADEADEASIGALKDGIPTKESIQITLPEEKDVTIVVGGFKTENRRES